MNNTDSCVEGACEPNGRQALQPHNEEEAKYSHEEKKDLVCSDGRPRANLCQARIAGEENLVPAKRKYFVPPVLNPFVAPVMRSIAIDALLRPREWQI